MPGSIVDLFGNKPTPNLPPGMRGFNSYAAGNKFYGGGRKFPNMGPVSGTGMQGYSERDNSASARKNAIMRRMRGQMSGNPMSSNVQGNSLSGVF
jgi:hypothetical protein